MTEEQRQAMIEALTAMIPDPPLPRYYRQDEEGYLTAVGIGGTDGKEISAGEYEAIRAVIAGKPTPPAGYDYRLRDDLHWQLSALPEPEEETRASSKAARSPRGRTARSGRSDKREEASQQSPVFCCCALPAGFPAGYFF